MLYICLGLTGNPDCVLDNPVSDEEPQPEETLRSSDEKVNLGILQEDIGFQIHITRRAIWQSLRSQRRQRKNREPSGYMASLVVIGANPGISQTEIAEALFIDPPNMASIMNRMVEAGLVLRTKDGSDRRRLSLSLTAAGQEQLAVVTEVSGQQMRSIAGGLTKAEMDQLVGLLKKVQASVGHRVNG